MKRRTDAGAKRPGGRPPLRPGVTRVHITARVDPETARYMHRQRKGRSLGTWLDEVLKVLRTHDL